MLTFNIQNGCCTIYIDPYDHFLSDHGFSCFQKLSANIRNLPQKNSINTLILWQIKPSLAKIFYQYLEHDLSSLLLTTWTSRVLLFRSTLDAIRKLPIPVIWVGKGDCLSSHWELALSAHRRISFGRSFNIGFPEVNENLLPPGGCLDIQTFLSSQQQNSFFHTPVSDLSAMKKQGLIQCFGGTELKRKDVLQWINLHREQISSELTSQSIKTSSIPEVSSDFEALRWEELIQYESRFNQQKGWNSEENSFYEKVHHLIRNRKLYKDKRTFNNFISKSIGYSWMNYTPAWRNHPSEAKYQSSYITETSLPEIIWVDTNECSPPADSISRLLISGFNVVLFSSKPRELSNIIERLTLKIEKSPQKKLQGSLWESRLKWITVDFVDSSLNQIKWCTGGFFECLIEGKKYRFLSLENNPMYPARGYFEDLNPLQNINYPVFLEKILMNVSQSVLPGAWIAGEVPSSSWIRLMFLQELLKSGQNFECEFNHLLNSLKEAGWKFLSSESSWEFFLHSIHKNSPESSGIIMPKREIWDHGRWKHIIAEFQSTNKKRRKEWHTTGLSQHFGLYAHAIAAYLFTKIGFSSFENICHLVSLSIGFPEQLGSPQFFFRNFGIRRALLYREFYWPELHQNARYPLCSKDQMP